MTAAFKADIATTPKFVLLALCDSANDQGECYPSVQTLMEKCSLSERAVQGAIATLEKCGFLRREFRTGRATVYWMTPASGAPHPRSTCTPAASAPPQVVRPTPAADAPPPPHHVHPTPAPRAPITINEPSIEPSRNQKTSREVSRPELVADGLDGELADAWLAHRKAKRAKLTPLAWAGVKREAAVAGWSLSDAVRKAIERNWTGFEASWVAQTKGAAAGQPSKHSGFAAKNYREGENPDGSF